MFRLFRLHIDFPALDRLMDYLEAGQQAEVDELVSDLQTRTTTLKQSQVGLEAATETAKEQ